MHRAEAREEAAIAEAGHPLDFLADIAHPETDAYQSISNLLGQLPARAQSKTIAMAGDSLMTAAAALALAYHGNEKVCLLEIGYEDPSDAPLQSLLGITSPIGISDVFKDKAELDNLIINARMNRPHPNCYVLTHGNCKTDWAGYRSQFSSLVHALSKKFHRVIVSLPALNRSTASLLIEAGIQYTLAEESFINKKGIDALQQHGCPIGLL